MHMMSGTRAVIPGFLVAAGALLPMPEALALFEPGVGAGLEYTDNAELAPNNEEDDLIAIGYVGAKLEQSGGKLSANATASLTYENYTDDTFDDQYYFDFSGAAGWEMVPERVNWVLEDYFTQRLEESQDPGTPNNIEDVNIFSTGPDVSLPLSPVQTIKLAPRFSDFYYESSDTDNQKYGLQAAWQYKTSATNTAGLGGGVSQTEFEDDDQFPDFFASNIHVLVAGQLSRSRYDLNLGYTHIDRDRFENQDGLTGNLNWVVDLTARSNARVYVASVLTDSSYSALESALDPGRGDVDNEQISGDILRNNVLRAEYRRTGARLESRLWGELRDLDYKETPDDREVQNLGVRLSYRLSPLMTSGLYTSYRRMERDQRDRTDKTYSVGGDLQYYLSRNLRGVFNLGYQDRDSNDETAEFKEFTAFAGLVYGYGNVSGRRYRGR